MVRIDSFQSRSSTDVPFFRDAQPELRAGMQARLTASQHVQSSSSELSEDGLTLKNTVVFKDQAHRDAFIEEELNVQVVLDFYAARTAHNEANGITMYREVNENYEG